MTTRSLKKFTELLNRSEGLSIIPIIVVMVIMSVMGGVFTSIMGGWKISAPMTINSNKAYYLAETAAMFALQDANNRFFNKDVNGVPNFPSLATGTRNNPFIVSSIVTSNGTETAEYWIERPYPSTNDIDEYPSGTHRGNDDDIITGANDDEDNVDDDDDDSSDDSLYTIIATGKVFRNGTIVAKRQIKIKATITPYPSNYIKPGVSTDGIVDGNGSPGLEISRPGFGTVTYNLPVPPNSPGTGTETDKVYRPALPKLDDYVFKAQAKDQQVTSGVQQYYGVDLALGPTDTGYPNGGYSFTGNIPNITFVGRDLDISGNTTVHGVYWVKRDVVLGGNCLVNGIIICEGNVTDLNGQAQVDGGLIQYGGGTITGNGNPSIINVVDSHFTDLGGTLADVNVVSWQEAVSAN